MNFEIIIVGAGSMGMAAGYFLASQGRKVLLIDAFDPPHTEGAHHGETRIIRHAYGEGENYVPMALRAQELWQDLEKKSNKKLFLQTGVLNVGDADSEFIQNVKKSAETYSLPVEVLTAAEMNERWSGFQFSNDYIGCFEKNSGVLMVEECVRAYRELAEKSGAVLRTNTSVTAIEASESSVIVKTDNETFTGEKLIVTAGRGSDPILSALGLELPLQSMRKTFSWFDSDEAIYRADVFPAFAVNYPDSDELYYGFPSIDGAGVKIGRHDEGQPVKPGEALADYGTFPEDEQDVKSFAAKFMSQKLPLKLGKTCVYTNSSDSDFIIDRHPELNHVIFACGFSGHGFKFASAVGEILSQLAVDGKSEQDISDFSMDRF
ncbi:N-methyltryptophan oxidase [Siminovitchia terrae]|uniref:N-methyltryptophan oxidase n=1 Tax=Siminovitchia terrae TaxID=1914933 RepID=A0ABQ4L159_SIMTE|nr:N-methyl-L-tryptophan oxidase [Siminovitchia terrae]GIN90540.1 N-methyltryptophan oxidase [Siminovitchia terrae]GIN97297.1 N-methyltryptophan oxidase [Siminovitchia terrae]